MPVYSLYVISKSGGVIYHQSYSKDAPKLSMNEYLMLGSMFHSLYAITSELSPVPGPTGGSSSGMQVLESDTFRLQCFQTPTGIKFYMTTDLGMTNAENLLKTCYELYTDYVVKNPFYELDQPIRCELFDINLEKLLGTDRT
eukprot:TRINITY_DN10227_c0_g1_i1.p2 TRINITY_DN10227_c0_g1~~TRINITY_DN10227_c0_g1_i1.p2  ORF type:complete len:142 (+),score=58.60 TRINITY_DN10227_c0_g1_i1:82-507(+)